MKKAAAEGVDAIACHQSDLDDQRGRGKRNADHTCHQAELVMDDGMLVVNASVQLVEVGVLPIGEV